MIAPSWTVPSPPTGVSGISATEAAQESTFGGTDIWFDVSRPDDNGEAAYVVTPAGDLTIVTGREALRQSLIRRWITNPGEWTTVPDYGAGARQYVKGRNTPALRAELESRIRAQTLRDKRVQSVTVVTVSQLEDGSAGIKISVTVVPRGRLRGDQALPIQIEVR